MTSRPFPLATLLFGSRLSGQGRVVDGFHYAALLLAIIGSFLSPLCWPLLALAALMFASRDRHWIMRMPDGSIVP